jgi:Tol biopolymer transport system component
MNVDGSDKRQVTKEDFRLLNQPTWSPDGRFIAAKKHFTTGRSLGTGEVWLYHVSGGGGVVLVKRASEQLQKELGEPIFARDGNSILYTRNITPGRPSSMPRTPTPTSSTSSATNSTPAR